jgi:hypothetical protein
MEEAGHLWKNLLKNGLEETVYLMGKYPIEAMASFLKKRMDCWLP